MEDRIPEDLWPVLGRYLAGEATSEDVERVRDWLAADPENAADLQQLQHQRRVLRQRPPATSVDSAWARVARSTGIARVSPRRVSRPSMAAIKRTAWWRKAPAISAAATVIVFVGAMALWRATDHQAAAQPTPAPRVYATQRAQRAEVQLIDGTRLVLAPESRLEVPHDFGTTHRSVTLVGEGHFDAAHDDTRPFIVHAGNALVRDIGTAFLVRAYATNSGSGAGTTGVQNVRVVVTEGSVQLRHRDSSDARGAILVKGMLGRVTSDGRTSVVEGVNVDRYLSWITGVLTLDNMRLSDAIEEIERWYDVDVQLGDASLAERRLTVSLHNRSLNEALEVFALSIDATVDRRGRTIILTSKARRVN